MSAITENTQSITERELLAELDRGIDDMEAGRELPIKEAMQMVDIIREKRRSARV